MAGYTPTPKETTKEKDRLITLVKPELKEHGLVDLTDFINKKSREGFINNHGFTRSVAYKIEELGMAEVIVRKEWTEFYIKRNIFSKRHPYVYTARLAAIGIIFSIIAGVSIALTQMILKNRLTPEQKREEFPISKDINDSLSNLRHDIKMIQDTLTKRR